MHTVHTGAETCCDVCFLAETKSTLAALRVSFAAETMRYFITRGCACAGDVPALVRRCAGAARLAVRWGRVMLHAHHHLAFCEERFGLEFGSRALLLNRGPHGPRPTLAANSLRNLLRAAPFNLASLPGDATVTEDAAREPLTSGCSSSKQGAIETAGSGEA
ncbi:BRCT domain-containing protein, partial [Operophtera brumata]